jgi:8-oxo-dGTP pyrophosphatase MutT (NUDIX family)
MSNAEDISCILRLASAFTILHLTFAGLVHRLEAALSGPLPGASAHASLSPRPRRDWPVGFNPAGIRDAAGLLLLFPIDDRPHIVLTVRADTLGRHGGQVSLPGGVVEPGESFEQAALREAHEEIGLTRRNVHVLGALTPLDIPVSGFRLHPIVAASSDRPPLTPSDGEVARILNVAVDELLDASRLETHDWLRDREPMTVPLFRVGEDEIWGATAMVLAEFLALLGWAGRYAT